MIHHAQIGVCDVSARSFTRKTQCCCMQSLRLPHIQSTNRQLREALTQLVFWGATCFNGLECAGGGKPRQSPRHVALWLSKVHDAPNKETTAQAHESMEVKKSDSTTTPWHFTPLSPCRCTANQLAPAFWLSSAQPPNQDDYRS